MDRREILQACLNHEQLGLEIGPLHNAICPKRDGWNVLIVDFKSVDELRQAYGRDPGVDVGLIEGVDIVAGSNLFAAVERYLEGSGQGLHYVVSSHNFEHQPDPIRFLVDCERLLLDGGVLSMAIPIASRCFDCWRPLTSTGDLFDAYLQQRTQPSPGSVLDQTLQHAVLVDRGERLQVNDSTYCFADVVLPGSVSREWVEARVVGESSLTWMPMSVALTHSVFV